MLEFLIPVLLGLPAAILALLSLLTGLIIKRYWLLLAGAILLIPSTYYLSGGPGSPDAIRFIPLLSLVAAYAVYKKKMWLAWLLLSPAFLAIAYFFFLFIYVQVMES